MPLDYIVPLDVEETRKMAVQVRLRFSSPRLECPFCFQITRYSSFCQHLPRCKAYDFFYTTDGFAKRVVEYFAAEDRFNQSRFAMYKWNEWNFNAGNGGKYVVKVK